MIRISTILPCLLTLFLLPTSVYPSTDSIRIAQDLQLARKIVYSNPDKAFSLIRPTISKSKSIGNELYAEACNTMGIYLDVTGNYNEALQMYRTGLDALKEEHKPSQTAGILSNIGLIYWSQDILDSALFHFTKAAELYELEQNANGLGNVYSNMGLVLKKDKRNNESISYFLKALKVQQSQNDSQSIARTYGNLGMMYNIKQSVDTANQYYQIALSYFHSDIRGRSTVFHNMAIGLKQANRLDSALFYARKALVLREEIGNDRYIAATQRLLGRIYSELNYPSRAIDSYERALNYYRQEGFKVEEYKLYRLMAQLNMKTGDYEKASTYWLKHENIKDSLNREINKARLFEIQAQYETEKQKRELAEKDRDLAQLSRDKTLQYAFLVGLFTIFSAVVAILLLRMKRAKLLKEKALLAQKVDLSQELHDHIGSQLTYLSMKLKHPGPQTESIEITNNLIVELRNTVWGYSKDITAKDLELKCLEEFNKLGEGITIVRSTQADHSVISARIATHILRICQEAIHNIYKHSNATDVSFTFSSVGGNVDFKITDNGVGFEPNTDKNSSSYGLKNMEQRASIIGGKLIHSSTKGEGTTIEFSL